MLMQNECFLEIDLVKQKTRRPHVLFKNGFKMLQSRELTAGSGADITERRMEQARQLRDLLRRVDLIRAIGVASRGS